MATTTMRVSEQSIKILRTLSVDEKTTMQAILDKAVETYRRKRFFEQANAAYAALRADPVAWAEELAERAEWDCTLMDGIDKDDVWEEDGEPVVTDQEAVAIG
jgi:hypothetical protein